VLVGWQHEKSLPKSSLAGFAVFENVL